MIPPRRLGRPLPNHSARPAKCLVPHFRGPAQALGSGLRPVEAQHFLCASSRGQRLVPVGAAYRDDCAGGLTALPCLLGQHYRVRCRHAVSRVIVVREDGFEPPRPRRAGGLQPPAFIRSAIHAVSLVSGAERGTRTPGAYRFKIPLYHLSYLSKTDVRVRAPAPLCNAGDFHCRAREVEPRRVMAAPTALVRGLASTPRSAGP